MCVSQRTEEGRTEGRHLAAEELSLTKLISPVINKCPSPDQWRWIISIKHFYPKWAPNPCWSGIVKCCFPYILANGLLSERRAPVFNLPEYLPRPRQFRLRALLLSQVHHGALEQAGASRRQRLPRVPEDLRRPAALPEPQALQHRGEVLGLPTGCHPQCAEEHLPLQGPREGQALLPHR